MAARSAREVLEDHLNLRRQGDLETDLRRNYSEDIVLLCSEGKLRGYDGVRESARRLREQVPNGRYEYLTVLVEGEFGFLEWSAQSDETLIRDGADSYLIRDGRIVAQSIHYRVIDQPAAK